MADDKIKQLSNKVLQSIDNHIFVKMTLSKSKLKSDLTHIYIRLIEIKNMPKLSFTYRYKTRDEVKNYDITEGVSYIEQQIGSVFLNVVLITQESQTTLIFNKKGENPTLNSHKNTSSQSSTIQAHNKEKKRLLNPSQAYFHALEITDLKGAVTPNGQKKFKQINKYIEIIDSILKERPLPSDAIIADFGSGKGYLTFALYDHLVNNLAMTPSVSGFELRENLTLFCNDLAKKEGFERLNFVAQDINAYQTERLDMLIALHACDIATDIAIAKGIKANAEIIIVAPCCHKQIRKALDVKNEMQPILKYGILEERQAELLTDGIRALILEANGYKTKVFEFVGTEHTPKNVMIVGVKTNFKKTEALEQVEAIKAHYGISYHALEQFLTDSV